MSSARKPLLNSPYGPANVRRISFKRLPKAIREAGISKIERQLETGTVTDLVAISEDDWHDACRRFNAVKALAELPGRQGERVSQIAKMFGATDRTVRRWLSIYRRNPDIAALLPRPKGQRLGNRRLRPDSERLLGAVIDVWAARADPVREPAAAAVADSAAISIAYTRTATVPNAAATA